MQSPWHPFFFLYPSLPDHAPMFSCAGRIAFPHILSWSRPPGEGGLPIHPSFLVPAGFLSRTYSHGRTCPARTIGAVPSFREYVFLSSYKTVFAVPSKPVMPARQKGYPVSVHVFLCWKDCLPAHIVMVVPARRGLRSLYHILDCCGTLKSGNLGAPLLSPRRRKKSSALFVIKRIIVFFA